MLLELLGAFCLVRDAHGRNARAHVFRLELELIQKQPLN
jgi:hypothetical protein